VNCSTVLLAGGTERVRGVNKRDNITGVCMWLEDEWVSLAWGLKGFTAGRTLGGIFGRFDSFVEKYF
jgi:hypothetical protein